MIRRYVHSNIFMRRSGIGRCFIIWLSIILLIMFIPVSMGMAEEAVKEQITLGKWSALDWDSLLRESSKIDDAGKRIDFLSKKFFNTQYSRSTLIGDVNLPEVFVINFEGVDCFTFLDYIEAMRFSGSFAEFKERLKKIRYRSGEVSFENRNHFFTDWKEFNQGFVDDVTAQIGGETVKRAKKMLNRKRGGVNLLPGIDYKQREIIYIPSDIVDAAVLDRLMTGDYVGIYTRKLGLDVSHVGIIIRDKKKVYFRHASSGLRYRKVIDQDFRKYIDGKPGIVVLRPQS